MTCHEHAPAAQVEEFRRSAALPSARRIESLNAPMTLLLKANCRQVGIYHLTHEFVECHPMTPAKLLCAFRAPPIKQSTSVGRKYRGSTSTSTLPNPDRCPSLRPPSLPQDRSPDMGERLFHELADRMRLPGREHIIIGLLLLHDKPHSFHIVTCVTPISPRIQVAKKKCRLRPQLDGGHRMSDLSRHESFAANRDSHG